MKHLAIFLVLTAVVILAGNFYFEYVISRECATWVATTTSIAMILVTVLYAWYVIDLVMKLLKLK
jgi:hypothetical protein